MNSILYEARTIDTLKHRSGLVIFHKNQLVKVLKEVKDKRYNTGIKVLIAEQLYGNSWYVSKSLITRV